MSLVDRNVLDFLLYDWLGADRTYDAVLDLSSALADEAFATHYKQSDQQEPFQDAGGVHVHPAIAPALRRFAEAGLFGATFDTRLGGQELPHVVQAASMALFMAANIATAAYPMLTAANARLIVAFGTQQQIDVFARPQIDGTWFGTMCLSEPRAGSSLADITTRAVPDGESGLGSRYRLFGTKMWISGGDHDMTANIVHLVLAKVPGTGGLSLFIVPKRLPQEDGSLGEQNDIAVAGLNHKMGYRGTVNCLLNFGENGGAVGFRVGAVGQGLAIMFQMMNEARIAVGLGAAALACRGYRQSLQYARERPQGRIAGAQVAIIAHPDVRRMLLAQKCLAEGALALVLYCAQLVDISHPPDHLERERSAMLLDLLTPIAKSWPSEFGVVANDLAIQVHGGYGYSRDFDVEQVFRDNRLNPIHEGTNGIQAIDLLGRKIIRDDGVALACLGETIARTLQRAGALPHLADQLRTAWAELATAARDLIGLDDRNRALDNASLFLSAMGHVVVAWLWLDQALLPVTPALRHGRLHACRYFFNVELPKARQMLALVGALEDTARTVPDDAF